MLEGLPKESPLVPFWVSSCMDPDYAQTDGSRQGITMEIVGRILLGIRAFGRLDLRRHRSWGKEPLTLNPGLCVNPSFPETPIFPN